MIEQNEYEQLSYGKYGYKRIQRLRRKGLRRGIEVPPLEYVLTKPERPRIAFLIAGIVGIILFVGLLVGAGFLIKTIIDVFSETFKDSGGFFKTLSNPTLFFATAGLSFVPLMLVVLAYMMLALIVLIPFLIAFNCYRFARNAFYMARCSKEEFAKGEMIRSHIVSFSLALVIATVLLIIGLVSIDIQIVDILLGVVYAVFVLIFGGLLAIMIVEKVKCSRWFDGLDEYKKQNFLAHNEALRKVNSRLRFESNMHNFLP